MRTPSCSRAPAPGWQSLGTARTDEEGGFKLALTGRRGCRIGLRDLYASSPDGSGVWFLALVAPAGSPMMLSDVDGTLTSKENAFPTSIAGGSHVGVQPGAPAVFAAAAANGVTPIFLSSRGDLFTQDDARRGSPRTAFRAAPIRCRRRSSRFRASDTVGSSATSRPRSRRGSTSQAGVGNRALRRRRVHATPASPADRIFIKLPEFKDEVAEDLARPAQARSASTTTPICRPSRLERSLTSTCRRRACA